MPEFNLCEHFLESENNPEQKIKKPRKNQTYEQ